MNKTEAEINAAIVELIAAYHEVADTAPAPELRQRTAEIQALRGELSALMSEGAQPCPKCGVPPHGMRKNPQTFEIGCLGCGGAQRAGSREEAVSLWNGSETGN